jgi:uncharacterized protein GlcG (DUF336 family)
LAAVNGSSSILPVSGKPLQFGTIGGVAPVKNIDIPFGRIDLVGVTLDIIGPHGNSGPSNLVNELTGYGFFNHLANAANANAGVNLPISNDTANTIFGFTTTPQNTTLYPGYTAQVTDQATAADDANQSVDPATNTRGGRIVPSGWLVTPHNGIGVTAAQVIQIVNQGLSRSINTRAAIRLPIDRHTRMVYAVADTQGNIVGLYREPDATIFSIDVAVAKARNIAYYNNAQQLQAIDKLPTVPAGTAITSRTIRYLADPRFPEGVDGSPPGPFSVLTDGGSNPLTGLNIGAPLPASAFQSVQGYDAFNPGTNFHDPFNPLNQNGIVFFPGSSGVYANNAAGQKVLVGGFGVSGDGVDQDDDVTFSGSAGFRPPPTTPRADQVFVRGVRLPYQKFNRNPKT